MRNYFKELHEAGLSYQAIAKKSGVGVKKVSAVARGVAKLKSGTPQYAAARNVSRRFAYERLRASGLTAQQADKYRRIALSERTYAHESTREVAHTYINKTMLQAKVFAEFENTKTHEIKFIDCFSQAYSSDKFDYDKAVKEAVENITIEGSNWKLKRIIDIEIIEFKIG